MHTKHKKFHIIRNMHVYNIHTLQYSNITRKMIIIMRGEPSLMARSGVTVLNI